MAGTMPALLEMALEGSYFRDGSHHHVMPYINTLQLPTPVTLDSGSMERHVVPHDAPYHQFRVMRYSNNKENFVNEYSGLNRAFAKFVNA